MEVFINFTGLDLSTVVILSCILIYWIFYYVKKILYKEERKNVSIIPTTIEFDPISNDFLSVFDKSSSNVCCILDIEKFMSVKEASTCIFKKEFTDIAFKKFRTEVIIKLTNVDDRIVITFCSSKNDRIRVNWKNSKDENFIRFKLDRGYSLELKSFVIEFLIDSLKSNQNVKFFNAFKELSNITDARDYNLLMIAVENERIEILRELLRMPFNINHKSKEIKSETGEISKDAFTAADIAWQKKNQKILLQLLKANSTYPKNFNKDQCNEEVKNFLKISENMHVAIAQNDQNAINKILKENKSLRHFYNSSNVSAAAAAIDNRIIYDILINNNCSIGQYEDANKLISELEDNLNDDDRETLFEKILSYLPQIHKKNFRKPPHKHILIHLSNSLFGHDEENAANQFKHIRAAFERIDRIQEGKILLQINAVGTKITNNVDFNRNSLKHMIPTVDASTDGLFYFKGELYFAAQGLLKNNKKFEVDGIIMHEHGHCAINKIFKNQGKPYAKGDTINAARFVEVKKECHRVLYEMQKQGENLENIVSSVYDYDEEEHDAEMIVRVPHMLGHYQNNQIKCNQLKVKFKSLFEYYEQVVMPEMKAGLKILEKLASESYEISFDELTGPWKAAIRHCKVQFQGQLIKLNEISDENVLNQLTSKQIKNILNGESIEIAENTEKSTEKYTERQFIDIKFKNKIWSWKYEEEENELTDEAKVAVQNFDSIFKEICSTKCFLLSGYPGEGKSTTMKHLALKIKKEMPQNWIAFIDLKFHTDVYEINKDEIIDSNEKIMKILIEVLKLDDNFEILIFKYLFMSGHVVLLFDGVDEISPKFENFFFELIKSIKTMSNNQQWIATRPPLIQSLNNNLNCKTYKLLPFNDKQALNFLNTYIKSKKSAVGIKSIESIIRKLEIYENPLMLTMVADLHIAGKLLTANFNKYSLYEETIKMKKEILFTKGKVANEDRDVESSISIWEVHKIFALKVIMEGEEFYDFFEEKYINLNQFELFQIWEEENSKWSPESISRYGLLIVNNIESDYEFVHRTYAEFFMTKFIIENIARVIESGDKLSEKEFELGMKFGFSIFLKRCTFFFIREFISHYFAIKQQEKFDFCKRFCDFVDRNETRKIIERKFSYFYERNTSYLLFISSVLKFSKFNERIFNTLTLTENNRSKLFVYGLNQAVLCIDVCAELFDIFKTSNLPNWHHLTGFGLKFSQTDMNLPKDDELEKKAKDFLTKSDLLKDYDTGEIQINFFSNEEEEKIFRKIYYFLCFIIKVDDFTVYTLEEIMHSCLNHLSLLIFRSQALTEKFFEVATKYFEAEKGRFARILRSCDAQINIFFLNEVFCKCTFKCLNNFEFFLKEAKSFFNGDQKFMQTFLSKKILCFGILTKSSPIKNMFIEYFNPVQLTEHTIKIFIDQNIEVYKVTVINAFDEFSTEISSYSCFFQLFLNEGCNFNQITHMINAYKAVWADEWRNHIGYESKRLKNSKILLLTNDEVKQLIEKKYLFMDPNDTWLPNEIKGFCEMILNFYEFLTLFVLYKIPQCHIENFLHNALSRSCGNEKHSISIEKFKKILRNLRNGEIFFINFHVYFKINNNKDWEFVENPKNRKQFLIVNKENVFEL